MAHRRLLQEASRLYSLGPSVVIRLQQGASVLPALQQAQVAWPIPALLRQLSGSAASSAAEEQRSETGGSGGADGSRPHAGRPSDEARGYRPNRPHGGGLSGWRAQRQPKIYIPKQWEQQGWHDREVPPVRAMLDAIEQGEAWEARRTFEAALAPLLEALKQGKSPGVATGPVPPPYAWKLYFAVLASTNCHPHHMSELLETMGKLGVGPQPACYAMALRQMAKQGIGSPAYTTILRMKDLGMPPTLRCYMYAIESCLRAHTPELSYARRLFDDVAAAGLAARFAQKSEFGKLLVHAVREFARFRRFGTANALLQHLEGLGVRVPAFLVADVLHMATVGGDAGTLLECVRRLETMTFTFQVPGTGKKVTRPLKVEEGLLLGVLEVAANQGNVELAEAAWRVLERSVALPNTPSSPGALGMYLTCVQELQHEEEQQEQNGEDHGEVEAAADGAHVTAAPVEGEGGTGADVQTAAVDPARLEQLSEELEASDAAAAEAAETVSRKERQSVMQGGPSWVNQEMALAEAKAMAAEARGVQPPSLLAHLALVHAYAKGEQLEGMFGAVERLQQAYPQDADAACYHLGLVMAVDTLAHSEERCDAAFFLLEGWAKQGRAVSPAQLNLVVAACCQIGDLKRAFETFDAYAALGTAPDADTYNALMQGCIEVGDVETALKVFQQMLEAEVAPNAHTHHQLVNAGVVAGNVPSMMRALEALEEAGHRPRLALLERCLARAERAGEAAAVQGLLQRLFKNDYRIVGVEAKLKRWMPEGGMRMLTGSDCWLSREEVLRGMRRDHSITKRIERRNQPQLRRSEEHFRERAAVGAP